MYCSSQSIEKAENAALLISGGIGKNIAATAVINNFKQAYPQKNLIVMSGFPDIFFRNPNIKRCVALGRDYTFYDDFINHSKTIVLEVEPYRHFDYVYEQKHLIKCWCDMLNVPCITTKPEMFFSKNELRMAQLYTQRFKDPMVLLQHCGGKVPKDKSEQEQIIAESAMYNRNLPHELVDNIVRELIDRKYMVGSIQHENQYCSSQAEKISFPIRAIIALIPYVKYVICIDSFLQHAAAIFDKPALVLWGGTNPKKLGYQYDSVNHITQKVCDNPMCHRPNSFFMDVLPNGFQWDCPHDAKCMDYNIEKVMTSFDIEIEKIKHEREDNAEQNGSTRPESTNGEKEYGQQAGPKDNTSRIVGGEKTGIDKDSNGAGEKISPDSRATCPCR